MIKRRENLALILIKLIKTEKYIFFYNSNTIEISDEF